MSSKNPEISSRAALIAARFEAARPPFLKLDEAIKSGHIEDVIGIIADWPEGKQDEALWKRVQELSSTLVDRANKPEGSFAGKLRKRLNASLLSSRKLDHFTEKTQNLRLFSGVLLRVADLKYDAARVAKGGQMVITMRIISAGAVEIRQVGSEDAMIFAKGDVKLHGAIFRSGIIVCGGNMVLDKSAMMNSLVIAKGTIDGETSSVSGSRVVSGKTATCLKDASDFYVITENESNPLGYIRWNKASTPGKLAPNSKDAKK
jgi:hypothetical protein